MTETDTQAELKSKLLDAALPHVTFDGWSQETFRAACRDAGIEPSVARVLCPRGPIDLALAYHERGDAEMERRLALEDLPTLRLRDRIATAILYRIEAIDDKEAVRRGSALFALPGNAGDGARAIWGTADKIWNALGDNTDDVNWYTKRASLAGVYSATVLYWLGDESENCERTWEFLHSRVDDVMNLERVRAQVTGNPLMKLIFAGPNWLASQIRPPRKQDDGFPGSWTDETGKPE
ncbi:COQ9 family protein [Aliiruegeria lutimaris]|uniref:Ubiquinone biosynthesis protein COQ9 n=1 Tax=Aliiruegeria lutimaris TaxID=571298 RepID=A0A1G8P0C3_9RHOB|nr:COQ9 family protein [Aliiruegeria lutimaris]SDI85927.1 ubiquinone biosynthesis protein COQ9 [Aliiruegeria lutimaris]